MKSIAIIGLLLLIASMAKAQLNFKPGYVITNSNDTIYGKINDGGGRRNSRICMFRQPGVKGITRYQPEELKGYRLINDKYYWSLDALHKRDYKRSFNEVLLEGPFSLYRNFKDSEESFYIREGDLPAKPLSNKEYKLYPKSEMGKAAFIGEEYFLNFKEFTDTLTALFNPDPSLQKKINNLEYDQNELIAITRDYVGSICQESNCFSYVKDIRQYKDRFGFYIGTTRFQAISIVDLRGNFSAIYYQRALIPGFFYNISLPAFSDNFSLQIDCFSNVFFEAPEEEYKDVQSSFSVAGIPLSIRYEKRTFKLSPYIGAGKNLWFYPRMRQLDSRGWFADIGLEYKMNPKFSIFGSLQYNYTKALDRIGYDITIDPLSFKLGISF